MQGRARLGKLGLGIELTWDTRQCASLEVKELGEQVTDGPEMILGK